MSEKPMKFEDFKDRALLALMGIGVSTLIWMASSITTLNINVAVVLEKITNHEARIINLETHKNKQGGK